MRRADRLIKLVHFIRSRRRAVTASQIAEKFGICTRTVYRDIQDLVDAGTPIIGEAGVGYLIDKQYYLPPITFDKDELEALGLGISMVRNWTDHHYAGKADSAFQKIQAVLPAQLQGELQQITTFAMPAELSLPWQQHFSYIREAIRTHHKLFLEYSDKAQQVSSRVVRPLALLFFSPVWIMVGWCELRQQFRHFRLDQIVTITVCKEKFSDEAGKDLDAYRKTESACELS